MPIKFISFYFKCVYYYVNFYYWLEISVRLLERAYCGLEVSVLTFWFWRWAVHGGISSKSVSKYNDFRLRLVIYPYFLYILGDWSGIKMDNNLEAFRYEMNVFKFYILFLPKLNWRILGSIFAVSGNSRLVVLLLFYLCLQIN